MSKNAALLLLLVIIATSMVFTVVPVKAGPRTITVAHDYQLASAIYGAVDGDTILVKNGTYEFPEGQTLVISRSISLIGEDLGTTTIKLHPAWVQQGWNYVIPMYGYEHPIEIQASNVKISGFTIASDGGSILATGYRVQIVGNKIAKGLLVNGRYQNVSQNALTRGVGCYGSFNTIAGNCIEGEGIIVGGSSGSSNMIYNNIVTDGNGISLIDYDKPTEANGNTVFNNTVKNCSSGLVVWLNGYSSNNTVYHNNFIGNNQSTWINMDYGEFLDNGKEGNYWSDYAGKDTNGDGVGDTPQGKDRYPLMYPWGTPEVAVIGLENATYAGSVPLNFTVSKPTQWMGYSLDGDDNVTLTGNTTVTGIANGLHNLTVNAIDVYGTSGASETIYFSVAKETEPEPFPTVPVAAVSTALAAVACVGILFYFKKHKH